MNDTRPEPYSKLPNGLRSGGHLARMSGSAAKVYMALLTRRNHMTGRLDPSWPTIQADAGVGRSALTIALRQLDGMGLIERDRTGGPNSYRLTDITMKGELVNHTSDVLESNTSSKGDVVETNTSDVLETNTTDVLESNTSDVLESNTQRRRMEEEEINKKNRRTESVGLTPSHLPPAAAGSRHDDDVDVSPSQTAKDELKLAASETSQDQTSPTSITAKNSKTSPSPKPAQSPRRKGGKTKPSASTPPACTSKDEVLEYLSRGATRYWPEGGKPNEVVENPSVTQVAGFWLMATAAVEQAQGIPITAPAVKRAIGIVARLQAGTPNAPAMPLEAIVARIRTVYSNWAAIAQATSWMTTPLTPSSASILTHSKVIELVTQLQAGKSINSASSTSKKRIFEYQGTPGEEYQYDNF